MPFITQYGGLAQLAGVFEQDKRTREAAENAALYDTINNFTGSLLRQYEREDDQAFTAAENEKNRAARVEDQEADRTHAINLERERQTGDAAQAKLKDDLKRQASAESAEYLTAQLSNLNLDPPEVAALQPYAQAGDMRGYNTAYATIMRRRQGAENNATKVTEGQANRDLRAGEGQKNRDASMQRLIQGGKQAMDRTVQTGQQAMQRVQAGIEAAAARQRAMIDAATMQAALKGEVTAAKEVARKQAVANRAMALSAIDGVLSNPESTPQARMMAVGKLVENARLDRNPVEGTRRDAFDVLGIYDMFRAKMTEPEAAEIYNVANIKRQADNAYFSDLTRQVQQRDAEGSRATAAAMIQSGDVTEAQVFRYLNSVKNANEWANREPVNFGDPDYDPDAAKGGWLQWRDRRTGLVWSGSRKQAREDGYTGP